MRGADGSVERIVETKVPEGVPEEELAIGEINIGTYAFDAAELWSALDAVGRGRAASATSPGVFPVMLEHGPPGGVAPHRRREQRARA